LKTIRASEIGTYLYCQRAWWYQQQGLSPENQAELAAGTRLHAEHGRALISGSCLKILAYLLILSSLVLLTIYGVNQIL
jgi:CRISPR/Cas system-associated exonuclease Cas4 (RecB family)